MKKKALVAMAMAAAMVAMPVVAGAVTSPGSQSDGTIGQDSSSQSQNNTNTGSQQGEQNSATLFTPDPAVQCRIRSKQSSRSNCCPGKRQRKTGSNQCYKGWF